LKIAKYSRNMPRKKYTLALTSQFSFEEKLLWEFIFFINK